jgi:hypothetical protein
MTSEKGYPAGRFNAKSGKGIRDGVVSELTAFFGVKPGHEDVLRAAVRRFAEMLRNAPRKETQMTGLRYTRHVLFDGGRRLLWSTGFESDWDRYIEDALVVVGIDSFLDWLQHTTEFEQVEAWLYEAGGIEALRAGRGSWASDAERERAVRMSSGGLKEIITSVQIPGTAYMDALADTTIPEIRKALRVDQAFRRVLDGPGGAAVRQHPSLKPLLELAGD